MVRNGIKVKIVEDAKVHTYSVLIWKNGGALVYIQKIRIHCAENSSSDEALISFTIHCLVLERNTVFSSGPQFNGIWILTGWI